MTEVEIRDRLRERLQAVEERIAAACMRARRQRSEVTLVATTKTVGVEVARLLPELGAFDLGESRPQELWKKSKVLEGRGIRWHLVGHLQRNKIKPTVSMTTLIHSVDSLRLLDELNKQEQAGLSILLEVNASREANKHGFAPEELTNVQGIVATYNHLRIRGFMTMAAYSDDPEAARATFREVRQLRDRANLELLSMGMSNDFEVAIEEGATHIRLGTVLFDGLEITAEPHT